MFEKQKKLMSRQKEQTSLRTNPKQITISTEKKLPHQPQSADKQSKQQKQPYEAAGQYYYECNRSIYHLWCNLKIKTQSCDCSVCCEPFINSEKVVQLFCGHIFHETCALGWLRTHNTCPYCRLELPTDDPEYERERRLRQQRINSTIRERANNSGVRRNTGEFDAYYG